jgi:hypothetical protein
VNEVHERFREWLSAGAEGDPARDVAVHASVCTECRRAIAALDLLAMVNPGIASMPAEQTGRERGRLAMAGRLVGATAVLFSAAILGVGVSQLIGVSHPNGPVAQASQTPQQNVLAGTAPPGASQSSALPSPPDETLTPLASPEPTALPPGATPRPSLRPAPTPVPTAHPTPTPTGAPSATPLPTETATPAPTDTPSPTPEPTASPVPPQCSDGIDNDGDGFTDYPDDLKCTGPLDDDEFA